MKAPDKIYVHVRTSPRPSITFSEAPEENSSNVEYIRKDALLEWAKEQEEIMKCGGRVLISDIIAKIESL